MNDINPFSYPSLEDKKIKIIAGPCSAESEEVVLETAKELSKIGIKIFRAGVWKPRTKPGGFCGVGPKAFNWLKKVKEVYDMTIAVEVATPQHCQDAKSTCDIFWIGARTVADPFAVQSIADWLSAQSQEFKDKQWILVKNPVSPDLDLWIGAIQRIYNAGYKNIVAIHRGFSTIGKSLYRNTPEWSVPIALKESIPSISIICDPSHISGKREIVASVSQQALDLGFDGLMIESHINPDNALTDAAQQLSPQALGFIIDQLVVRDNHDSTENMKVLRNQIDMVDDELLVLLMKRFRICRDIGKYKKEKNIPILQSKRFAKISQKRAEQAYNLEIDPSFIRRLWNELQNEAIRQQLLQ